MGKKTKRQTKNEIKALERHESSGEGTPTMRGRRVLRSETTDRPARHRKADA